MQGYKDTKQMITEREREREREECMKEANNK